MSWRRITIRVAMGLVAVAGLVSAVACRELASRRAVYLTRASHHEGEEGAEHRKLSEIEEARRRGGIMPGDRRYINLERSCRLSREYHAEMAAKYHRAACRPWLTVAPDRDDPGERLSSRVDSLIENIPLPDFVLRAPPGPFPLGQKGKKGTQSDVVR